MVVKRIMPLFDVRQNLIIYVHSLDHDDPPQSPMYEELCEALENGLFKSTHGQSSPPSPPSTSTENNETAMALYRNRPHPCISTAEQER